MTKREEFEAALDVLVMAVREHAPEMGHGPKAQARARVLALYDEAAKPVAKSCITTGCAEEDLLYCETHRQEFTRGTPCPGETSHGEFRKMREDRDRLAARVTELEKIVADDTDLHLVIQGVKHYWLCTEDAPCWRCRADALAAIVERVKAVPRVHVERWDRVTMIYVNAVALDAALNPEEKP